MTNAIFFSLTHNHYITFYAAETVQQQPKQSEETCKCLEHVVPMQVTCIHTYSLKGDPKSTYEYVTTNYLNISFQSLEANCYTEASLALPYVKEQV